MTLYIYAENAQLRQLLFERRQAHRYTDSGFNIPLLNTVVDLLETNYKFRLGVKVAATDANDLPMPCLLLPRSSLSNTYFRLANSIGLIDMGYRGEVQARVDILHNNEQVIDIPAGTCYFQLCRHNFMPWDLIVFVENESDLPRAPDNRGEGGFGSTGQ
jgi:dUTPase